MHTCVTLLFQLGPQPGRGLCPGDSQSASCELALQSQPHPHSGSRLLNVAQGTWPEGHGDAMSTDTEHGASFLPGPPSARAGRSWEKPQHWRPGPPSSWPLRGLACMAPVTRPHLVCKDRLTSPHGHSVRPHHLQLCQTLPPFPSHTHTHTRV